jgi:hypothetical protein
MTASQPLTYAPQTLDQRLAQGPIPMAQALSYVISLGECLRQIHESGRVHGVLSPSNIILSGGKLAPGTPAEPSGNAAPYTAPELLAGHAPDSCSDIFSFGAVASELITGGRPPVTGEGATPSGNPGLDRVLAGCMAKTPAERYQRMQKVLLELKLVPIEARLKDASGRRERTEVVLRSELQQLEVRLLARIEAREEAASADGRAAIERLAAVRDQILALSAELTAAQEGTGQNIAGARQMVEDVGQRLSQAEQSLETIRQTLGSLHENTAAEIRDLRKNLDAQGAAIESACTALAQTDDVLERLVDGLVQSSAEQL